MTFFGYIIGDQIHARPYQHLEEMGRRNNRQHEATELDREWGEADDLGKWRVLEKVEKMLDRLKSDKNGTKSTSLNRDTWELEIEQWSLWRKKKIMTIFLSDQRDNMEFQRRWEKEWENNRRKQEAVLPNGLGALFAGGRRGQLFSQKSLLLTGALASTHLTLLSGFGWWFWSTLPNFGINQECIPSIRFVFFTKPIPITSAALRSGSKSIYIFSSLPVINIFIWMYIFTLGGLMLGLPFAGVSDLIIYALKKWAPDKLPSFTATSQPVSAEEADSPLETTSLSYAVSPFKLRFWGLLAQFFFAVAIIMTLTVQTFLITLTELTIAHNKHLIQSKEGDWTFGQTLALTLTLIPLIEVVKFLWEKRPWAPKESGEGTETRETGWVVETGGTGDAQESGETREARESGETREAQEGEETREAQESGETREAQESGEGRGKLGADNLV